MIDYKKFHFYSAPRMATTWMVQAAAHAGFGEGQKYQAHIPPDPGNIPQMSLSMVRDPADWLLSYYYELEGGTTGISAVDKFVPIRKQASSFLEFFSAVMSTYPEFPTTLNLVYAATSIIRVEDLPYAATDYFKMVSHPLAFDADDKVTIANMPPVNARKARSEQNECMTPWMRKTIRDANRNFYETYDY